ncbi:MAG: glycosyltransferase [Gammaproteobacteria bacterium]|nr:glycosyltransferase [Gammaproteobacteria bacterium]
MQIFVIGMHRSGTSLTARLLNLMGAYFGPEGVSTGANQENPKGFWERRDVRALNDMILHSAQADWNNINDFSLDKIPQNALADFDKKAKRLILELDAHRPWFLKEPRFCLTFPLWRKHLEVPVCIHVYRTPIQIAQSLRTRNGFSLQFGIALWEKYTLEALKVTKGYPNLLILHSEILAQPLQTATKLYQQLTDLGCQGLRIPHEKEILAFVSPELYRERGSSDIEAGFINKQQAILVEAFESGQILALASKAELGFSAGACEILGFHEECRQLKDTIINLQASEAILLQERTQLTASVQTFETALRAKETSEAELQQEREQLVASVQTLDTALDAALRAKEASEAELQQEREQLVASVQTLDTALDAALRAKEASEAELQQERERLQTLMQSMRVSLNAKETAQALVVSNQRINRQLFKFLEMLQIDTESLISSWRWRIGDFLVRIVEVFLLRPKSHLAIHHMQTIFSRAKELTSEVDQKKLLEKKNNPEKNRRSNHNFLKKQPLNNILSGISKDEINLSVIAVRNSYDRYNFDLDFLKNKVTIVVPIFNSSSDVMRCVLSVLNRTTNYELLLIDDCSTEPMISKMLDTWSSYPNIIVLRNEKNQGFVKSANQGLTHSKNDVVLLNSDTKVTKHWLTKLLLAAYSSKNIATVTPFSNAAGAFSVPETGKNSPIPDHLSLDTFSHLVDRLSQRDYIETPTGNGFCLYIKRQSLNEAGYLDEEAFGMGYGEENDLCMRMINIGWKHIVDDSTLIYHKGSASFGKAKENLVHKNRKTLDNKHPNYTNEVRKFVSSPILANIKKRISNSMHSTNSGYIYARNRILFVLHEGGGGVIKTTLELHNEIYDKFEIFVLTSNALELKLKIFDKGKYIELISWPLKTRWSVKEFNDESFAKIYRAVLIGLNPDTVHIRSLFKHTFDMPELCLQLGYPTVISFHDFYLINPSVQLLSEDLHFCPHLPESMEVEMWHNPSSLMDDVSFDKDFCILWKEKIQSWLLRATAFITTAEFVKSIFVEHYPLLNKKPFFIFEHGCEFNKFLDLKKINLPIGKIKILCFGNLDIHKGSKVIRDVYDLDKNRGNIIEFHFLGSTDENLTHVGIHHGKYKREKLFEFIKKINPDMVALPCIWGETYSHTLTEAWVAGLPVIGTRLGAIGERITKHGGGWIVDTNDPDSIYEKICYIATHANEYNKAIQEISKMNFKHSFVMGDEYAWVYNSLSVSVQSDFLLAEEANKSLNLSSSKMLFRLAVIVPKGKRGSTYIRCFLPYSSEPFCEKIHTIYLEEDHITNNAFDDWLDSSFVNAVLVQRDALSFFQARSLIKSLTRAKIPLYLDLDDDLLSIDKSHPEYNHYLEKIQSISLLIESAKLIILSTEALQQSIIKSFGPTFAARTFVFRNALDERLWFSKENKTSVKDPGRLRVGYFGSKTHDKDLDLIIEAYYLAHRLLLEKHRIQIDLEVISGYANPPRAIKGVSLIAPPMQKTSYIEFVRWLQSHVNWDFAVAPLINNSLNSAKSDLKFLEYSALGIPGVFSSCGEYANTIIDGQNGLLVSSNSIEEWCSKIVQISLDKKLREQIADTALSDTKKRLLRNTTSALAQKIISPHIMR